MEEGGGAVAGFIKYCIPTEIEYIRERRGRGWGVAVAGINTGVGRVSRSGLLSIQSIHIQIKKRKKKKKTIEEKRSEVKDVFPTTEVLYSRYCTYLLTVCTPYCTDGANSAKPPSRVRNRQARPEQSK